MIDGTHAPPPSLRHAFVLVNSISPPHILSSPAHRFAIEKARTWAHRFSHFDIIHSNPTPPPLNWDGDGDGNSDSEVKARQVIPVATRGDHNERHLLQLVQRPGVGYPLEKDSELVPMASTDNGEATPILLLETLIHAPVERVFDLARSIDAHVSSTSKTGEKAVEGRTSGLIERGETVTWEARHFGVQQRLSVRITEFDRPNMFADEMITGAFKSMHHTHRFAAEDDHTRMIDEFEFAAPLGLLGRIAERLFLNTYMARFLADRNQELKALAESDDWRMFLEDEP